MDKITYDCIANIPAILMYYRRYMVDILHNLAEATTEQRNAVAKAYILVASLAEQMPDKPVVDKAVQEFCPIAAKVQNSFRAAQQILKRLEPVIVSVENTAFVLADPEIVVSDGLDISEECLRRILDFFSETSQELIIPHLPESETQTDQFLMLMRTFNDFTLVLANNEPPKLETASKDLQQWLLRWRTIHFYHCR